MPLSVNGRSVVVEATRLVNQQFNVLHGLDQSGRRPRVATIRDADAIQFDHAPHRPTPNRGVVDEKARQAGASSQLHGRPVRDRNQAETVAE